MAGYYNGFTPRQRALGGQAVNTAWLMGELEPPTVCEACGSTTKVQAHNENYDTPLDYFAVCYTCHMMIHCRFRAKARWQEYLRHLRYGDIMRPATDWLSFRRWYLQSPMEENVIGQGEPREPSFLHELPTRPIDHAPVGVLPARLRLSEA